MRAFNECVEKSLNLNGSAMASSQSANESNVSRLGNRSCFVIKVNQINIIISIENAIANNFFQSVFSECVLFSLPSVIVNEFKFDFNLFDYYISVFSFWWLLGLSPIKIENEHSQSGGKTNEKSLELLSNKKKTKGKKHLEPIANEYIGSRWLSYIKMEMYWLELLWVCVYAHKKITDLDQRHLVSNVHSWLLAHSLFSLCVRVMEKRTVFTFILNDPTSLIQSAG